MRSLRPVLLSVVLVLGCEATPDDVASSTASGGSGGATANGPATTTSSAAGTGSMVTGSSGSGLACNAGETVSCPYNGTPGTEGQGPCVAATKTCNGDGTAFGPCSGEVTDVVEVCGDGVDQDCNGVADDDCCVPDSIAPCYSGPAATEGVGECVAGTHTCNAQGTAYGPCTGEVVPATEDCADATDSNCNGREAANGGIDDLAGCQCLGSGTTSCYSGPAGTAGVGKCKTGSGICVDGHVSNCAGQVVPAAEVCAAATGDEDCNGFSCTEPKWLVASSNMDEQYGQDGDVATDPAGNVYWSGIFRATITIGGTTLTSAGAEDIFVSKWTPQGSLVWAKRFGGTGSETPAGLAADATNVYVLANNAVDFGDGALKNVAKLTGGTGALVWSRGCSIPPSMGGVTVDPAGNVIFGTYVQGASLTCDGGPTLATAASDYWTGVVVKYGPTGAYVFGKTWYGTTLYGPVVKAVAADASGNIWFGGSGRNTDTFGCANTLPTTKEGAFYVKLDPAGNCLFQAKHDTGRSSVYAIALDSAGGPIIGGSFSTTINLTGTPVTANGVEDSFILKLNAAGAAQWAAVHGVAGSGGNDFCGSLAVDGADAIVAGYHEGTSSLLRKYSSAGSLLWARGASDAGPARLGPVATGGPGNWIFEAGSFSMPISIGPFGAAAVANTSEAYLARIDP